MASTISIPGTESQRAIDLLKQRMPQAEVGNASARIVFTTTGGAKVTSPASVAAIEQALHKVALLPHVVAVLDPYTAKSISLDQHTAVANVLYNVQSRQVTDAQRSALQAAGRGAESAGVQVQFGGTALSDFKTSQTSEIFALGVAAVVLFITFGALVAVGHAAGDGRRRHRLQPAGHPDRHPLRRPAVGHRDPRPHARHGRGRRLLPVHRVPLPP